MATLEQLTAEVHRIVIAPYAVSLKALHDIVQHAGIELLDTWANAKPCQIKSLAIKVHQVYEKWDFVPNLVERLVAIREFRDAILVQNPAFLEHCLVRATQHESRSSQAIGTAVALLSYRLPRETAIPSLVADLLNRLILDMVQNTSANTIRPVYGVLHGLDAAVLGILPDSLLDDMSRQCRKLLKDLSDHVASLLCLGIFATCIRITSPVSSPSASNSTTNNEQSPKCTEWYQEMVQVFTGRNATKTLDLIVWRVILFCSESRGMPEADAIEGIKIATRVASAVDSDVVKDYRANNQSKMTKLIAKMSRPGLESQVQVEALSFCTLFDSPRDSSTLYHPFLQQSHMLQKLHCSSRATFIRILQTPDPHPLNQSLQSSISVLVEHLLDLCRPAQQYKTSSARILKESLDLCGSLYEAMKVSHHLRTGLQIFLQSRGIPDWWDIDPAMFEASTQEQNDCNRLPFCLSTCHSLRRALSVAISRILLASAWSVTPATELSSQPDSASIERLLDCLGHCPPEGSASCYEVTTAQPLYQQHDAEETHQRGTSRNWQSEISNALLADATMTHGKIINFMEAVCQDLQDRCENVEKPLRKAENTLSAMSTTMKEQKQSFSKLQDQFTAQQTDLELAKSKLEELAMEKAAALSEVREISQQLESAHHDLEAMEMSNEAKILTLEHRASATLLDQEAVMGDLRDSLSQEEQTSATLRDKVSGLEAELELNRHALRTAMSQAQDDKFMYEDTFAKLDREHEARVATLEQQLRDQTSSHHEELDNLHRDLKESNRNARSLTDAAEQEQSKLQDKIKVIRSNRNALKRELANANDIRTRLAAVINIGPAQPTNKDTVSDQDSDCESSTSPQLFPYNPMFHKPNHQNLRTPGPSSGRASVDAAQTNFLHITRRTVQPARRTLGTISPNKTTGDRHQRRATFEFDDEIQKIVSFDENDENEMIASTDLRKRNNLEGMEKEGYMEMSDMTTEL